MIDGNVFVPRILLCGDKKKFFSQVGNRPYELVGQISFFGKVNEQDVDFLRDNKFILNGNITSNEELLKRINGGGYILSSLMPMI